MTFLVCNSVMRSAPDWPNWPGKLLVSIVFSKAADAPRRAAESVLRQGGRVRERETTLSGRKHPWISKRCRNRAEDSTSRYPLKPVMRLTDTIYLVYIANTIGAIEDPSIELVRFFGSVIAAAAPFHYFRDRVYPAEKCLS
jgi:hypothetical protein